MTIISLDQKGGRVQVGAFEIENQILFDYFNKIAASERDEQFHRALYIGVLALMEDRLSSFFAKTSNELGTELESLKLIFDMKKELFYRSAVKGVLAEEEIAEFLIQLLEREKLADRVELIGDRVGSIRRNKTGDILCYLNGDKDRRIVIECKFDKSIRLGDIRSKDVFARKSDTAWSQLLEAQANRDGLVGIIVFDISLVDNSVLNTVQDVRFIPGVGLIAIIDSQKGDYRNLAIAYMLARDIAMNARTLEFDQEILKVIVNRLVKDARDIAAVRNLVLNSMENLRQILFQTEKSVLLAEFNQRYLAKFLVDGTLSKADLLDFYVGEEVKDRFRLVEREISDLCTYLP